MHYQLDLIDDRKKKLNNATHRTEENRVVFYIHVEMYF